MSGFEMPDLLLRRRVDDGQYWVRLDTLSVALLCVAHRLRDEDFGDEAELIDAVRRDIEESVMGVRPE